MTSDWSYKTLEEISAPGVRSFAMGPFGSNIRKENYRPKGVPVIRGLNLNAERFYDAGFVFLSEEKADELKNSNAFSQDIIFTAQGSIGQVGIIPKHSTYPRYILSQNLMKVTCDTNNIDPLYVFYYFRSHYGQLEIFSYENPTGVPCISQPLTSLKSFRLPVPPLPEQRAITVILGTLDDKIELNRQMNKTLEAMARSLFKSWFVDFEPFRDHGMEDSTMGPIPRGWEIKVLDDLTNFVLGGDWGKDDLQEDATEPAYCIRGADIPDLQHAGVGKMPIRYLKPSSLGKRSLCVGDIVIEISGGSPTQSTGRTVLVTSQLLDRLDHSLVCSNFCRLIRLRPDISPNFVYYWMRRLYETDVLLKYETGTTSIKNFAYTIFSNTHPLVLPPAEVLNVFDKQVQPLLTKHAYSGIESESLANIRDTLLPKLLSGEIRVKDAEKFVEVET